jgi:thiol-disulfide isomerase/thioredoxin
MKLKLFLTLLIFCHSTLFAQESVRPWIGINIDKHEKGVLIKSAIDGTPGARAGLKKGDIVLTIDGQTVTSPTELISVIRAKGVGHQVKIQYLTSTDKKSETTLKLEAMPGLTELAKKKLLNKKSPPVKGMALAGNNKKEYDLSKDKKVKLIEFWATWCGACLQAHPFMNKFAKKNAKNISVLSISSEEVVKVKKYLKIAKKQKVLSGSVIFINDKSEEITASFFVPALPTFLVLDKDNTVKYITVGVGQNLLKAFEIAEKLSK